MRYLVEAFDKATELLVFDVELPSGCDQRLKEIMGWMAPQQGWEGYELSAAHLIKLGDLSGRTFDASSYNFQLTVNI
ncbi:hypothetical protein [Pseudomonas sp. NPDC086251]|jgi:hypothetical protein|uniref:DUF7683 domain-containing protein n=1 Tax=Pseudomonas sp. NPDC086251 TaxID=3364431 RepID=UPI003834D8C6